MTKVIDATNAGSPLFNALAIGLGLEILNGQYQESAKGAQLLLDEFALHHPLFIPKTWQTLFDWLKFYNNPKDIERILAPVLFKLHLRHQIDLQLFLRNELITLVQRNKVPIEKDAPWSTLTNRESFPILDSLPDTEKAALLVQLKALLAELKSNALTEIRKLVTTKGQALITSLDGIAKADGKPFHRAFSCAQVKGLADALDINIGPEGFLSPSSGKTRIDLRPRGKGWEVHAHDDSTFLLDKNSPPRLKMTHEQVLTAPEAHQVLAPTTEQVIEARQPRIEVQFKDYDNPGAGNCAFYAFAIGIIHIIQQEALLNRKDMFEIWKEYEPSLNEDAYQQICRFDLQEGNPDLLQKFAKFNIVKNSGPLNKAERLSLLNKLQQSLRNITYTFQVDELKRFCALAKPSDNYTRLTGHSSYALFARLYYPTSGNAIDLDPRFNPFVGNKIIADAIAALKKKKPGPKEEDKELALLFLKLLYGEAALSNPITEETEPLADSPILECMKKIRTNFLWGERDHLNFLAEAYEVNLHVLVNGTAIQAFRDLPNRHTVRVNNKGQAHWTTELSVVREYQQQKIAAPRTRAPGGGSGRRMPFTHSTIPKSTIIPDEQPLPPPIVVPIVVPPVNKNNTTTGEPPPGQPIPVPANPVDEPSVPAKKNKKVSFFDVIFGNPKKPGHITKSIDQFEKEREHLNKEREPLRLLKKAVNKATMEYKDHSNGIWFSFIHRHGKAGRIRAADFNNTFSKIKASFRCSYCFN